MQRQVTMNDLLANQLGDAVWLDHVEEHTKRFLARE